MATTIHVPDVCERDIDLLLLEEFVATPQFRSWFLSRVGIDAAIDLADARRSVKTENGESDLEIVLHGPKGAIKIVIENKVDATFQPNQPQRYMERAIEYKNSGKYQDVVTVIMAPAIYFGEPEESYEFDAKVTYEDVVHWFSCPERKTARTAYKLTLLHAAIDRGRSGWQLIPHANVGRFWRSYWQLSERIARQLSMPVPKSEIPAGSHFIGFRPPALPGNVKLKHKVAYGHVDLEFSNMGSRLVELERLYGAVLPQGARIEKAAKSAVVRIRVDPVDMTKADFALNEAVIRKGIESAVLLFEWFVAQQAKDSAIRSTTN